MARVYVNERPAEDNPTEDKDKSQLSALRHSFPSQIRCTHHFGCSGEDCEDREVSEDGEERVNFFSSTGLRAV